MHINNKNLPKKILSWYDNNKRILPWRISQKSQRKQYYRLLSEFMLQQTRVKTVIPYFKNFVEKIPNLKALSTSNDKKVLKLWEGLGYYRRAKNLHKTTKILIKKYNGKFPKKFEEIKKLPGIGEYTANALLALIYNQPRIPFDGNINRVFSRLFNTNLEKNEKRTKRIINEQFYTSRNGDLAEALMEFGAAICKPCNPLCNICNLKINCYFFKNKTSVLVNKKRQKKEKKYNVYCYLKKQKKEIALTKNKNFSFLSNFKIPEIEVATANNKKNNKWTYLCNYKNNISNIRMNINLFYKFVKNKSEKYTWHSIDRESNEFIPSFTKIIFKKIAKVYN
jgi:A/G-specific adenine glycosylase